EEQSGLPSGAWLGRAVRASLELRSPRPSRRRQHKPAQAQAVQETGVIGGTTSYAGTRCPRRRVTSTCARRLRAAGSGVRGYASTDSKLKSSTRSNWLGVHGETWLAG